MKQGHEAGRGGGRHEGSTCAGRPRRSRGSPAEKASQRGSKQPSEKRAAKRAAKQAAAPRRPSPLPFFSRSSRFSICVMSARASSKLITSAGGLEPGGGWVVSEEGAGSASSGLLTASAAGQAGVPAAPSPLLLPTPHPNSNHGCKLEGGCETPEMQKQRLTRVLHGVHPPRHVHHVAVLKAAHHLRGGRWGQGQGGAE